MAASIQPFLDQLRSQGRRITRFRRALLELLVESHQPMAVDEMMSRLMKKGVRANKTTFYREVEFLKSQGWLQELSLAGVKKYYEWCQDHHHHLVCKGCHSIEEIDVSESEMILQALEQQLSQTTQFQGVHHSLEFFGLCPSCS